MNDSNETRLERTWLKFQLTEYKKLELTVIINELKICVLRLGGKVNIKMIEYGNIMQWNKFTRQWNSVFQKVIKITCPGLEIARCIFLFLGLF